MNKEGALRGAGVAMQHLYISIRLPDGHWAGDVSRSNHHIILRIEEHMALSKGRGSARGRASGYGLQKFKDELSSHLGVEINILCSIRLSHCSFTIPFSILELPNILTSIGCS